MRHFLLIAGVLLLFTVAFASDAPTPTNSPCSPCNVTTQTGCDVDQYCEASTTGGATACYSCPSLCPNMSSCPAQCQCRLSDGNACPRLVGYCPVSNPAYYGTCQVCSKVSLASAPGNNRQSQCQCTSSDECPENPRDHTKCEADVPMYCAKRDTEDNKDEYHICDSCEHCFDAFAIEGACPPKCVAAFECSKHSDCSGGKWCDASHKCKPCGATCYTGSFPYRTSIDGVCPMACCDFMDITSQEDGAPLVWAPCERNTSVAFAFRYSYSSCHYTGGCVSPLQNSSDGMPCTAIESSAKTDDGGTRRIFTVMCDGFNQLYSTCDQDKMHVYVSVSTGTRLVQQWDKHSDNLPTCALTKIVTYLIVAIAVPVSICILVFVACMCCRRRSVYQQGALSQQFVQPVQFAYAPQTSYGSTQKVV